MSSSKKNLIRMRKNLNNDNINNDDNLKHGSNSFETTAKNGIVEPPKIVDIYEFLKNQQYEVDNDFLHSGWRLNHFKLKDCVSSILTFHNETLNIWTHLIGSIILIIIMIWFVFNLDASKDFYVKMGDKIKDMSFELSLDSMSYSIEIFKENLLEIYQQQSSNIKDVMNSLVTTINSLLSHSQIVLSFPSYIMGIKNLNEKPTLWVSQMSEYHKFILDVNQQITGLKSVTSLKGSIDYNNMAAFQKLGNVLPEREGIPNLEIWPIILFLFCAMFCLLCSVTFHVFHCMNQKTYKVLQRFDLSGISINIFGSVVGTLFYAHYCDPIKRNICILIQFISCFGTFYLTATQEWLNEQRNAGKKAGLFVLCGLFAGLAFAHIVIDSYLGDKNSLPLLRLGY